MNYWNNVTKNLWQWVLVIKEPFLDQWLASLKRYHRLLLGFSGGLDSTVLLHLLATTPALKDKVVAIHIHHGLNVKADEWSLHAQRTCQNWNISFECFKLEIGCESNVENTARKARYAILKPLLQENDALLTAHHQQDQAETVLLQLCRGTGIDGLAAIAPQQKLAKGHLLRPLLSFSRSQLEHYARHHNLVWIEDDSNQNTRFSRNFIRHQVIPLLEQKWPATVQTLARAASNCQDAQNNLEALAIIDCPELRLPSNQLNLKNFDTLSFARKINIVRLWLKNNGVGLASTEHLQQLLEDVMGAEVDATPCLQWGEYQIRRYQGVLYLLKPAELSLQENIIWHDFPQSLTLSASLKLQVTPSSKGVDFSNVRQISVGYRQGGEKIRYRGQTKCVKKLLQSWKVPPWEREKIPFIYCDGELAIIVGYAMSDHFYYEGKEAFFHVIRSLREVS